MSDPSGIILDLAPDETPAGLDAAPAPQHEMLASLSGFMDQLILRDEETNQLLSEIRVALDALVSRLPAPTQDSPAPVASAQLDYGQVIERTRACVAEAVPAGSSLSVINKGDIKLLRHDRRVAQHYPQASDGSYAGFYPNDSTGAIAQLERTRETGIEFLVIPATGFWWLEHYEGLRRHLDTRYRLALRRDDACVIYDLRDGQRAAAAATAKHCAQPLNGRIRSYLAALLPAKAHIAVVSKGDPELLAFKRIKAAHFSQTEDGDWTGYHPADSSACIAQLDELIAAGVRWLVFPQPQAWYLEHYSEFAAYLTTRHRLIVRQRQLCVVYALNPNSP